MSFYMKLKCKTILLLNYLFQILYEYVVCFNKLPENKKELLLGCFFKFVEKNQTALKLEGGGGKALI